MTIVATPLTAADLSVWSTPDVLGSVDLTDLGALQAVHRGVRANVYPVVPESVRNVDHAEMQLKRAADRYFAEGIAPSDLPNDYLTKILAGEDLDDTFIAAVEDYIRGRQYREAAGEMLNALRNQLQWRRPRIVSDAVPAMLHGLRTELEEVLGRVTEIAAVLDGLDVNDATAVAGATTEQRAVFPEFPDLIARYWRVRNGQRVLYAAGNMPVPGNTTSFQTWSWAEYLTQMHHWEFSTGVAVTADPDKGAQTQRLLTVAALKSAWLPTYDQLLDKYNDWWNSDPIPLDAPALPPLQPGQHYYRGNRG